MRRNPRQAPEAVAMIRPHRPVSNPDNRNWPGALLRLVPLALPLIGRAGGPVRFRIAGTRLTPRPIEDAK